MALMATTLRLEAANGSGAEEYRIDEGAIEVRTVRAGEPISDACWRRLSHAELSAHVRDETAVAQWLRQRIGWRRLLRACINPKTLEEFGISENTLDRYAA